MVAAHTVLRLTLAALLVAASGVWAQTAETAPDHLQESYRDWVLRCQTPQATEGGATTGRICEIAQELTQSDTNQRVLTIALQALPDETARLTLVTPFGLRLSDGVAIDVAPGRLTQLAFRTCLPQGCIASGALDIEALERLSTGEKATVQMTGDSGQPFALEVSLNGFAAAWSRLTGLKPE